MQVATDAEFELGAGRPYKSLLGVMWGTGVGGGIILDGKPWLGPRRRRRDRAHGGRDATARRCPCGRRGCMEAYAGRAAMEAARASSARRETSTDLFKIMKERGRTKLTSSVWARALERGDKLAIELIDEAVEALGAGIASAVNLLDVEAVVIGGGLGVRFGEPYVKRIRKAMRPASVQRRRTRRTCWSPALGDLGGALGAALLVSRAGEGAAAPAGRPSADGESHRRLRHPVSRRKTAFCIGRHRAGPRHR